MDAEDDINNFLSIELSAPSTSTFYNDEIHSYKEDNSQSMQMTLLDGTFFKYVPEKSTFTKKVGICVKCLPKTIEIKGHNKSSSNFVTHLKRKHGPEAIEAYRKHLQVGRNNKIKRTVNSPCTGIIKTRINTPKAICQEQFDTNLANYFIHSMIPLRTVEDPFFVRLINNLNISDYDLKMPSERSLGRKIIGQHFQQMSEIKEKLVPVKYVCTTADIWSRKKISFLCVTVHWIDKNLERQSAAVACRRFKGAYTYDQITKLLNETYSNFGLDVSKVVATIIDNGYNFIEMFRIFGVKTKSLLATEYIDKSITFSDNESETGSIHENPFKGEPLGIKADITHIKTEPLDINHIKAEPLDITHIKAEPRDITQDDSMENSIRPPDNLRCCAHILNLSASADVESLLSDNKTALGNMHEEVVGKCSVLWNAAGQSKSIEIIQSVLGHTLTRPEATRWNSLYHSLNQIAKARNKILLLSRELGIKNSLNDLELDYIEEYVQCVAPIADALDILKGDDTFYGVVLPCLLALRKKLRKLYKHELKYCKQLIKEYLKSVERRFHDFYSISSEQAVNSIIAALSYPRFKNKWFTCIEPIHHAKLMNLFETEICKEINQNMEEMETERVSCKAKEDDFFDFRSESESMNCSKTMAEMIMLSFFAEESQNVNVLKRYPFIQKVFIKYNTPMPSSGPVDKMFDFTMMINYLKSHNLSDKMFENRVVMKRNLNFFKK